MNARKADEPTPTIHPNLAAALAAFQADLPTIGKDNTATVPTKTGGSYQYKYADLSDVSRAVLPALARHGLSFSSKPTMTDDGHFVLAYVLRHESGQEDAGIYPLPCGGTPQSVGSALTYARRYVLSAMTGVAPDEDDDGQAAQHATYDRPPARQQRQQQSQNGQQRREEPPPAPDRPSGADAARDALRAEAEKNGWDGKKIAAEFASRYEGASLKEETNATRIVAFTKLLPDLGDQLRTPATNGAAR